MNQGKHAELSVTPRAYICRRWKAGHSLHEIGRALPQTCRKSLHRYLAAWGWDSWVENWLRDRLKELAKGNYENQVSAVVAKLHLRSKVD
jgi:hypothetical protein